MTTLAQPRQLLLDPRRRAAFGSLLLNEARLTWRRPVVLVTGLAIPVGLLILFGELPSFRQTPPGLGGLTLFDVYVPVLLVFGLAMLALLGLPMPLASYRELGVLRRLSTTPVPPSWLLAAEATVQMTAAVIEVAAIIIVSIVAFGAPAPKSTGGIVVASALAIAAMVPVGLLIAALASTANAASVIGRLAFFPLMFFAGLWLPRALMPHVLHDIANYTPLGAAAQAIQDSMLTGFPPVTPLLTLAAYAVVFAVVAARLFRWE
ncbi:MAG TPA: ABC transporter permease [Streptosporangiaceae bacterium]|jgi:ABC-2 type transport system permease protein